MTPEERARATVLAWWRGPYIIHNWDQTIVDIEVHDVAAAIRAAVEAERGACALLALQLGHTNVERAIRARGEGLQ